MVYNLPMLRFLRVRNFAVIDELSLEFESGFNLLSGETGAGKSILIDALGLLAGAKASSEMIRSGESRAVVEAVFEADVNGILDRLGLDSDGNEIVIRREISADDRNRVHINSQPATVAALRELAPWLLDIHGQHDQQTLLDAANQLEFVDAFAESGDLVSKVADIYTRKRAAETELADLDQREAERLQRLDFLGFQRSEIEKLQIAPGEEQQMRGRFEVLAHAEKLFDASGRSYAVLYETEDSVLTRLSQVNRLIREASTHDERLRPILEQCESVRIQLQDVADALRDYREKIDVDPRALERLQERLAEFERLHRKYGADLPGHLERVRHEIDRLGSSETRKDTLRSEVARLAEEYESVAAALSRKRRGICRKLERAVEKELRTLAMQSAVFALSWSDIAPGRGAGKDRVDFLISPNPGEEPRPLTRIASGGELSRIMLALRTVLAVDHANKTLIFDEVDAGVGGKAAETVGAKLKELSGRYQILGVSHLAQVAAFSDHHFRIEKVVLDGRTFTRIDPLEGESRIEELARMMSGTRITDAVRQHARELLSRPVRQRAP